MKERWSCLKESRLRNIVQCNITSIKLVGRVQSTKLYSRQIYLEVSEQKHLFHFCIVTDFRFDSVSQNDPAAFVGNNSGGHNDSLRSDNEKSF